LESISDESSSFANWAEDQIEGRPTENLQGELMEILKYDNNFE
jgi:hypothetical protein